MYARDGAGHFVRMPEPKGTGKGEEGRGNRQHRNGVGQGPSATAARPATTQRPARGWTVADLNYDLLGSLTRQGNVFGGIRRGRVNRNSVPPYLRLACGVGQSSGYQVAESSRDDHLTGVAAELRSMRRGAPELHTI